MKNLKKTFISKTREGLKIELNSTNFGLTVTGWDRAEIDESSLQSDFR